MIAKVIVDIPARQVNRSFDYHIPSQWNNIVEVGSRVKVPFASMERMGFVIEITDNSEYKGQLKEISSLMDYQSFFNRELVDLSSRLSQELNCFQITVLQAMLPSLLRAKYKEVFEVKELDKFGNKLGCNHLLKNQYDREELEGILSLEEINTLLKDGIIESSHEIINQANYKEVVYLKLAQTKANTQKHMLMLPDRNVKQKLVLDFLINYPHTAISRSSLLEEIDVSHNTLKTLEKQGWLLSFTKQAYRDPLKELKVEASENKNLFAEQSQAYQIINQSIQKKQAKTFLLEGVTGSGKTEVYLQLMDQVRKNGQTSILLVPEISLTPQMVERVISRFSYGVAVLHSGLSVTEKFDEWQRIIKGEATIVVGARSSIFAPMDNIGLIIIDEEHETTYKQSDNPRYHARDVAKWRSDFHSCPLLLGSATPSLESRARAEVGNYHLIQLTKRANQQAPPPVEIIDMTQEAVRHTHHELSTQLESEIHNRLEKKEQIVILLNRRGYASYILCRQCGYIPQCPRCDISLTYHKADQKMKCHYCDYFEPVVSQCPNCHSSHIRSHGLGTQKVLETLNELFPQANIIRMDNDTTRRKGQYQKLLKSFELGQADILLGTQMIAKGLDFANVTLVGVINADTSLNLPDFRSGERTFQLLSQVSGRAGRGDKPGQVLIQTYNPDHYVMKYVKEHDYEGFFYQEMQRRHITQYPPYFFTSLLTVSSNNQGKALEKIYNLKVRLSQLIKEQNINLIIIGPNRGSVAKINNKYYFNLLLKYKNKSFINDYFLEILNDSQESSKEQIYINLDHEPQFFL